MTIESISLLTALEIASNFFDDHTATIKRVAGVWYVRLTEV